MPDQALSGVKVVDLSWHIAGPYCTKLLADYGAEVIKVERPDVGDPARRMGPFFHDDPHPEKSGLFLHLNTSKKGITLNLKTSTGRKILKDLVKDADLLVESFRPRVMTGLGLDYKTLEEVNPRLLMASISKSSSMPWAARCARPAWRAESPSSSEATWASTRPAQSPPYLSWGP